MKNQVLKKIIKKHFEPVISPEQYKYKNAVFFDNEWWVPIAGNFTNLFQDLETAFDKLVVSSKPTHPNIRPLPNSMWLVVVECQYNVVKVSGSGKGFYIPGYDKLWNFEHVSEWIKEIVPPAIEGAEPAKSNEGNNRTK